MGVVDGRYAIEQDYRFSLFVVVVIDGRTGLSHCDCIASRYEGFESCGLLDQPSITVAARCRFEVIRVDDAIAHDI